MTGRSITKGVRRTTGRLQAILVRYYPAALELFGGLQAQITLSFLLQYNTPQAMAGVSYEQFKSFVHGRRYPRRWLPKQYARLQRPQPEASLETVQVYQDETKLVSFKNAIFMFEGRFMDRVGPPSNHR